MRIQHIAFDRIRRDVGTQMRVQMSPETVRDYAEQMRNGLWDDARPVCVVFYDEAEDCFWLADGFHRLAAFEECGFQLVKADVRNGTRRDAVLEAARANALHGLPRTTADKRRAIETLLADPEWSQWSNREIARHIHVDDKTVGKIRAEIETSTAEIPQLATAPTLSPTPETVSTAEIPQLNGDRRRIGRDGRARRMPIRKSTAEIPQLATAKTLSTTPGTGSTAEIPQLKNQTPESNPKRELNWQFPRESIGFVCPICLRHTEILDVVADHDDAFGCCAVSGLTFKEITDGVQNALDRVTVQRNGYAGKVTELQEVIARYQALFGPLPAPGATAEIPQLNGPATGMPSETLKSGAEIPHLDGMNFEKPSLSIESLSLKKEISFSGDLSTSEREGEGCGENPQAPRFKLSPELVDWCAWNIPQLSRERIDVEVAKFHDHHKARGSRLKDPNAALRKWLRDANQYFLEQDARKQKAAQPYQLTQKARAFQTRKINDAIDEVVAGMAGGRFSFEDFRARVEKHLHREGITYDAGIFDELINAGRKSA